MANPNTLKVKLNRGIVLEGIREPRTDSRKYGKPGDVVEIDKWTASHLADGDYPAAEIVSK